MQSNHPDLWAGIAERLMRNRCSAPAEPQPDPSAPPTTLAFDLLGPTPRAHVPACRRCADREGHEVEDEIGYIAWVQCPCVAERRRAELWQMVGLPRSLAPCALSSAAGPEWRPFMTEAGDGGDAGRVAALAAVRALLQAVRSGLMPAGLLLTGAPGLGKSHLLAAACSGCTLPGLVPALRRVAKAQAERLSRRYDGAPPTAGVARYVACTSLAGEAHGALDVGGMTRLRDVLCSVPVLALDELGDMKPGSWLADLVGAVLHQRHEHGLTTIVASNYRAEGAGPESLAGRVPPHILSRLRGLPTVAMSGDDWRGGSQEARQGARGGEPSAASRAASEAPRAARGAPLRRFGAGS